LLVRREQLLRRQATPTMSRRPEPFRFTWTFMAML
jgi:hypothetical protein